jgi:hypothetical protein
MNFKIRIFYISEIYRIRPLENRDAAKLYFLNLLKLLNFLKNGWSVPQVRAAPSSPDSSSPSSPQGPQGQVAYRPSPLSLASSSR